MLYLNASADTFQLDIPLNGEAILPAPAPGLAISARNTSGLDTVELTIEEVEVVGDYARVSGSVPAGIYAGEWHYELQQGAFKLSEGLLTVEAAENPAAAQYETQIEFKQYGSEH